jgi:hypothetical protein
MKLPLSRTRWLSILDSKPEPPSVSVEVLEEYYFLRDIAG